MIFYKFLYICYGIYDLRYINKIIDMLNKDIREKLK